MNTATTPYRVLQCSKCQRDTEYYCKSCQCNLCQKCKENHDRKRIKQVGHDIVAYRDKFNYIPKQEICASHPSFAYRSYCEPCQIPECEFCFDDQSHIIKKFLYGRRQHRTQDIQGAYNRKIQQHRETIHIIRSETLFCMPVLHTRMKTDYKTCQTNFTLYQ